MLVDPQSEAVVLPGELVALVARQAVNEGPTRAAWPGLMFCRFEQRVATHWDEVSSVSLGMVVQGRKRVRAGSINYFYDPFHYLVMKRELRFQAEILQAAPERPFLSFVLQLQPELVNEVYDEMNRLVPDILRIEPAPPTPDVYVMALDQPLVGAVQRFLLVLSRFVQGAGAAFVSPSALSLLTTTNAEGAARNRALSIWQASTAGGASAGVIAGGVLTQYLGWRAIFLVNVPIIAVLLLLIPRVIPDDKSTSRQRIDVLGAVLVTASAAALIYGLSSGQQQGFGSLGTVLALGAAVLLALVFVLVERTTAAPMVPFSYFSSSTHRAAVGAMLLMGAVLAAYVYFTSLYMQRVLGMSAVLTGLSLIPSTATVILTSTFATRRLLDRLGIKRMLLIGLASMGVGQVWLSFMTSGGSYVVNVLPGLLLTALGIALALPTASIGATTGVDRREQGLAGGLLTTGQQIGSAVGLALLATIAAARTVQTGSLAAGYGFSYLVATGIVLIAMVLVATQLNHKACQSELARQRQELVQTRTDALLRKG